MNLWVAVSRIWLVIVNVIFLSLALACFILASKVIAISNQAIQKVVQNAFIQGFDIRAIAIALLLLAFFFLATAVSGFAGGFCRISAFLTFYTGALILDILMLISAGFYGIFKAVERKNAWAALNLASWNALDNPTKDFVQQAFSCCGFTNSDTAFKGISSNFWGSSSPPKNACASSTSNLAGCKQSGDSIYNHFVNVILGATLIGLFTCMVSVVAANAARRRRALVENGFLRTGKNRENALSSIKSKSLPANTIEKQPLLK